MNEYFKICLMYPHIQKSKIWNEIDTPEDFFETEKIFKNKKLL